MLSAVYMLHFVNTLKYYLNLSHNCTMLSLYGYMDFSDYAIDIVVSLYRGKRSIRDYYYLAGEPPTTGIE